MGTPRTPRLARPSSAKRIPKDVAQAKVLTMLAEGAKVIPAMQAVGRAEGTYRAWMENDPAFRERVRILRDIQQVRTGPKPIPPDFPEFCSQFMGEGLDTHHLRIWDVLCGRPPRDMHPSITYEKGRPNYVLSLMPPEHGKSTQFTMNYVTWRIVCDPTIRVTVLSAGRDLAAEFLLGIKDRLTGELFREMQVLFQPDGGWKDPDRPWTATQIYVATSGDGHKDPTVKARGVRTKIYGSRAHLIVGDDISDMSTAAQYGPLAKWIGREVVTRLTQDGTLLFNGTRVAPLDVYKVLRAQRDSTDTPVYSYLAQPAVLDYADDPRDWVTLWPGHWDGPALDSRKATIGDARSWALIYQQDDVAEDAIFPAQALECAVNRNRKPGVITEAGLHTRPEGMRGLYVIGGLDLATTGHTAAVVMGVERASGKRYVLDCWDKANCSPDGLIRQVQDMTGALGIRQWVVESNAFQKFLTQLDQFRLWLYSRGVRLREHQTQGNKWDADFGVAAMAGLFLSCGRPRDTGQFDWERTPDSALIELPSPRLSRATAQLIEQLAVWHPTEMRQRQQTDLVMALWMANRGAIDYVGAGRARQDFLTPQGATRGDLSGRTVINLNELAAARDAEKAGVA